MIRLIPAIVALLLYICSISPLHAENDKMESVRKAMAGGDYNRAVTMLEDYIEQNPDSTNAYVLLVRVRMALGGPANEEAAEHILNEGLDYDAENTILIKLMSELKRKQNKVEEAMDWLERALEIEPADQKTLDLLIEYYTKTGNSEKVEYLRSLSSKKTKEEQKDPLYFLSAGKSETSLGNAKKAIEILKEGVEIAPDKSALHRALSLAYLEDGQKEQCCVEYYRWLETEDNPAVMDPEFQIAALIMSDEDNALFNTLSFGDKADFLAKFWRMKDPYPFTAENEHLFNHLKRISEAKKQFGPGRGEFGFDDRGKVYVRWGPPEESYAEDPKNLSTSLEGNAYMVRDNESWYYPSISEYLAFDFVGYKGYYRLVSSLLEASIGNSPRLTRDIYRRRAHLGGIYSRLAISTEILPAINSAYTDVVKAIRETSPIYAIDLPFPELEFLYRTAQFRGNGGKTRIDLAFGVPLKQLQPKSIKDTGVQFIFQSECALLDSIEGQYLHAADDYLYSYPSRKDYIFENYVGEERHEAAPGDYKLAFEVIEATNKKGAYKVDPIRVRDFRGDTLMVSGLKFSSHIESRGIDSLTGSENLSVIPYPYSTVDKTKTIFLYFEIYNLFMEPGSGSRYRISLGVAREGDQGNYVAQSLKRFGRVFFSGAPQLIETVYEREGNAQLATEFIELDLLELESGNCRLTVSVEDLVSKRIEQSSVEFILLD